MTLREALTDAENKGVAIGHFNVSDSVAVKGIIEAARELNVPVILGASEGEREFAGVQQLAALIKSYREQLDSPIYLNADHTHSLAGAVEAARAGFDSIVFDLSALPLRENIHETQRAAEIIRSIHPSIVIEGEIGDIGTGSEIHEDVQGLPKQLSTADEATEFMSRTGVDVLAPAVGNSHGLSRNMVDGEVRKRLDITRIREIKTATRAFMTLHGGSGTEDDDLKKAILAGINIVHINTEIRIAWKAGLLKGLAVADRELAPYKILAASVKSVRDAAIARLRLFNGV